MHVWAIWQCLVNSYADDDDDLKIEVEQLRELARQFTSWTFVICQVDKGQRQGTTAYL